MDEHLSMQMACIIADAKAERLAAKQETHDAKEFVKTQVAELNTRFAAEQQAREIMAEVLEFIWECNTDQRNIDTDNTSQANRT